MIRRPPRSTLDRSSAASDVYKRQASGDVVITMDADLQDSPEEIPDLRKMIVEGGYDMVSGWKKKRYDNTCLLYTSDAADERSSVDLGGRRIIKKKKR